MELVMLMPPCMYGYTPADRSWEAVFIVIYEIFEEIILIQAGLVPLGVSVL